MHPIIKFIRSKPFWVHFSLASLSVFILIFVLIKMLGSFTDHGEFVLVPDFSGKRISELKSFVSDKSVGYEIVDSIYDPDKSPGVVTSQDPYPDSKVKHNRIVYLYVTSMVAPSMEMPKLIDRSERQAKLIITSYGLKVGNITTKSADCNGCVLEQLYHGAPIEPGKGVRKGSKIDLVIGVKEWFAPNSSDSAGPSQPEVNEETFDKD